MKCPPMTGSFLCLVLLAGSSPTQTEKPQTQSMPSTRPAGTEDASSKTIGGVTFGFEDQETGAVPRNWTVAETSGAKMPAVWKVEASDAAPGGKQIVRLAETKSGEGTFNLLLYGAHFPANLELSVKLRADGGAIDQGGGLVWRVKDADNYYITRWNPLEENLRIYKVEDGKRKMLKSADVKKADPRGWHELRVKVALDSMKVMLNGQELLSVEDGTFTEGGKIGLWTKADAATSFDDLEVKTATPKPGR